MTVTVRAPAAELAARVKVAVSDVGDVTTTPLGVTPVPLTASVVEPATKLVPVTTTATVDPAAPLDGTTVASVGVFEEAPELFLSPQPALTSVSATIVEHRSQNWPGRALALGYGSPLADGGDDFSHLTCHGKGWKRSRGFEQRCEARALTCGWLLSLSTGCRLYNRSTTPAAWSRHAHCVKDAGSGRLSAT